MFINKRSILREIFPYLKLKDKNLSFGRKIYIYLEIGIMLWIISWLLLMMFSPLFYDYKNQRPRPKGRGIIPEED